MNIKNYTSEMTVENSIGQIEKTLANLGAKSINKEFYEGTISGIKFLIDINGVTFAFALPAKVSIIYDVLWKKRIKDKTETARQRVRKQAERTAWKIINDWVSIQATLIYLQQAEVLQVFFPYAMINSSGTTVYEHFKADGFKQLAQTNQ